MGGPHYLGCVVPDATTELLDTHSILSHFISHVLQFLSPDVYKNWPYCKGLPNNTTEFPSTHVLMILKDKHG